MKGLALFTLAGDAIKMNLTETGRLAKAAARELMTATTVQKNKALAEIAAALEQNCGKIIAANAKDIENGKASGMSTSFLDRLALDEKRVMAIASAVREIIALKDPVGIVDTGFTNADGLRIVKQHVPLGVIAIIYEARPNVTVDAAALCLKSSNAVILRGGKEAINSNLCLGEIMRSAVQKAGINPNCINVVEDTTRESSAQLMTMKEYVDVLIPRGSAGLIKACVDNAKVPVIETGAGNCHVYIDKYADLAMGARIINNAKTSRPSVCNAAETLLVHADIAKEFLPMAQKLLNESNVEIRGCERTQQILDGVAEADETDYATEYNDYILAVKVVDTIDEAIDHIVKYSTGHSECIVTESITQSQKFTDMIDCAAVYVNASTRFTDGGVFGLGAEIGISTQKLHTRGPMGLEELTTVKYIIHGNGQIR